METIFKYNGKIISTPNLEKKLKRMKISIDDIEIMNTPIKRKEDSSLEDYMLDKEEVVVRSTLDNIRRICFISKNKPRPTIGELFRRQGIYSEEMLMTMYYEGNI